MFKFSLSPSFIDSLNSLVSGHLTNWTWTPGSVWVWSGCSSTVSSHVLKLKSNTSNWCFIDYFRLLPMQPHRSGSVSHPLITAAPGWTSRKWPSGSSKSATARFLPPAGSSSTGSPGMLRCWWNPDWDQISWQKINTCRRPWLWPLPPAPAKAGVQENRLGPSGGRTDGLTDRGAFYFCTPLWVILHRKE